MKIPPPRYILYPLGIGVCIMHIFYNDSGKKENVFRERLFFLNQKGGTNVFNAINKSKIKIIFHKQNSKHARTLYCSPVN